MALQERIAALESRLSDLEAREGIRNTIGRYARGVDEAQYDELMSIMTDNIVIQTSPWWDRIFKGKEGALSLFRDYHSAFQHPRRWIANQRITVDGETGKCSADWFVVQSHSGQSYIGWGTYDWEFRFGKGIWKITKMVITLLTMTTLSQGWGMEQDRVMPLPSQPPSQ